MRCCGMMVPRCVRLVIICHTRCLYSYDSVVSCSSCFCMSEVHRKVKGKKGNEPLSFGNFSFELIKLRLYLIKLAFSLPNLTNRLAVALQLAPFILALFFCASLVIWLQIMVPAMIVIHVAI